MESVARSLIVGAASLMVLVFACGASPSDEGAPAPFASVPSGQPTGVSPSASSSAPKAPKALPTTIKPPTTSPPPPPPPPPVGPPCGITRTDIKGSQLFCGNQRLYEDDPIKPPWTGTPNTSVGAIVNELGRAGCRAPETVLTQTPAPQNFEIRGWVWDDINPMCGLNYDSQEEYFIDVRLDLDWTPDPPDPGEPPLIRLHSMADLIKYLPATNLMNDESRQIAGADDSWAGGGPGRVIIHVEVDGWGPTRGGDAYRRIGAPPGWVPCGIVGGKQIYHHKDILAGDDHLHGGDYVRIIGTQWSDDTHILPDGPPTNPSQCWARHVADGDYKAEIHTADKVQKLPEPIGRTAKDIIGYASCSTAPLALTDHVLLDPPPASASATDPDSGAPIIAAPIPGDHIVKVIPALWPWSDATFSPPVFDATSVTFNIQSSGPMLAFYRVIWSSCVPDCTGRCGGTDGCGGVCAARACGPTQVCDKDGMCSCPAGSTMCPDTCRPLAPFP